MKRHFPENTGRTTAGCLPIPLFNQRKRTRQPLTSNPLQNELGSTSNADNFDFSAMLADFGWETAKPESTPLQKTASLEESSSGANIWKRSDFSFGKRAENRPSSPPRTSSDGWKGSGPKQLKLAGNPKAFPQSSSKAGTVAKGGSSASSVPRGASFSFKPTGSRQEADEKKDKPVLPDDNTLQKGPVPYAKREEERGGSLRILSVVINSMKHWSQFAEKTPLLFEVLGVLDSAVTPGPHGGKNFLLRDGKESVSCVFYEIDRDLPRLIRGRVHRCMGNYDVKKNLLRCVSVRPATADEEHTFQDFVQATDLEMAKYEKTSREV